MRFTKLREDEQGMALTLAVFGLVVIGALVAGSFFVGRVEQVSGYNTVWASQAGEAAEAGLSYAMAPLDPDHVRGHADLDPRCPERVRHHGRRESPACPRWSTPIRPAAQQHGIPGAFHRTPVSAGGQVLATQTLAQFIRLAKPTIGVNAAVTVQDPINFNGNSFEVDGYNGYPPGWGASDCPTGQPQAGNTDDVVAIRSSTGTGITRPTTTTCTASRRTPSPNDPTITSDTFRNFLDYTYWTLAGQAGVKVLRACHAVQRCRTGA